MMDESGVGGDVVHWGGVKVGEVAAPAPGNEDLGSRPDSLLQDQDPPPPGGGFTSAHQSRGPAAKDKHVIGVHADRITAGGSTVHGLIGLQAVFLDLVEKGLAGDS